MDWVSGLIATGIGCLPFLGVFLFQLLSQKVEKDFTKMIQKDKPINTLSLEDIISKYQNHIITLELPQVIKIEFPEGENPIITYPKDEPKKTQPIKTDIKKKTQLGQLDYLGFYHFYDIKNANGVGTTNSIIFNSSDNKTYKPYIYLDNKWQEIGSNCRLPYNQIEFSLKKAYYDPVSGNVNLIWQNDNQIMRTNASAIIDSINYINNNSGNSCTISGQWGTYPCFKV